ncbi:hypothetical protein [Ekhidna sp.]|uniref:hypothetical protein n=1 Tax=Ekhidna sp. TaxID=2608089 RepID=UPI003C7EB2B8
MPKFLNASLTLILVLIIFSSCNMQKKTFELELPKVYKDITNIEAYASCQGPNGSYKTTVKNQADGTYEFRQDFSYRDHPFHGIVTANNEGFLIDSLGNRADTLSREVVEILRSHAFHKIHVDPDYAFTNIQMDRSEGGSSVFEAVDRLGNPVSIIYDSENKWISTFEMRNPMDTGERIEVRYTYKEETPFGPLANKLVIIQGGKDVFTFNFDSVFINDQKITF